MRETKHAMLYGNLLLMVVLAVIVFMLFMAIGPRPTYAADPDSMENDIGPDENYRLPRVRRVAPPMATILVWQCNDIRVTVTATPSGTVFDLGGSIWGGSQFLNSPDGGLFFNGRPCALIARQ